MTSIIELYEYQIHQYDPINFHSVPRNKEKHFFKFNDIDDSPDTECKRITVEGSQINSEEDTSRSSCDPIYNINGGALKPKNMYDLDNIYGNYKLFLANNIDIDELDESSVDKLLTNITETINVQINLLTSDKLNLDYLFNEIINKKYDIFTDLINHSNKSRLEEFANQTSIIHRLDVKNTNKIILIGDLHGSFHTFFRILCRLHRYGVLNLDTFEINEPYKIIFLGDILDRGMYALDILNIVFKLIIKNNTNPNNPKIIYNRGNHENYDQYLYKFENSVSAPIAGLEFYYKFNNPPKYNEFIIKFNYLLCILPSAVVINNLDTNDKFWCCHGGFPDDFIINPLDFSNKFILIENTKNTRDIRWSDFGEPYNGDYYSLSARGAGLKKYTHFGLTKFLENNNIKFLIRGHQDSYDNSVLFKSNGEQILINDPKNTDITNILIYNKNMKNKNRFSGPIARLILNLESYTDIYPVLTISTNTDNGRYLNSDSFALLKFNINSSDIEIFDKNILTILNSIKNTLKNENINKDNIILNNLQTCKKILEIYIDSKYIFLNCIMFNPKFINYKQNINSILENKLIYLQNIYNDVYDIVIYYYNKIQNLRTKIDSMILSKDIIFINDTQLKAVSNIIIDLNNTYKSILLDIETYDLYYDSISDDDIKSNLDNHIKNNNIDQMTKDINILIKEYESYNA
jgi:hypothetical protein